MRLCKSWSGFPGCSLYLIKSVVSGQLTSQSLCEVEVVSVHSRNVHWVRKTEIISLPWLMIILYFTLSTRYIGWPGGSHFSLLSKRTRAKYFYFCAFLVWCVVPCPARPVPWKSSRLILRLRHGPVVCYLARSNTCNTTTVGQTVQHTTQHYRQYEGENIISTDDVEEVIQNQNQTQARGGARRGFSGTEGTWQSSKDNQSAAL